MGYDFKKGMALGVLATLSATAVLVVVTHKKHMCGNYGKNNGTNLHDMFMALKCKMKKMGYISKATYDQVVTELVRGYAKQKGLLEENVEEMLSFFKGQWEMLQRH